MTSRTKKVVVPIRGGGMCPTATSVDRLNEKECNTQACIGDEVCVAKQDLILLVDGSGSLREPGFEIVRGFAVNLTKKYHTTYFGGSATRIGVALFGNGHLETLPDGSTGVARAINVQPLSDDMNLVREKLSALEWQRGFTNMAQGLALAGTMLSQGGRADAQSAVMVLSDGKFSFKYETAEKARELKDQNIQLYMAPITPVENDDLETLKTWASQPWETNFERIPGLDALEYNSPVFVEKLVTKFCPDSVSMTLMTEREKTQGYMLVHEGGWPSDVCGNWTQLPDQNSMDDCASAARTGGRMVFSYGFDRAVGRCYMFSTSFTQAAYDSMQADRVNPECPGGAWDPNPYYDTYAINPSTLG